MDYLSIDNFKCFTKQEIPLNFLTVLAGANGNGKSTAIQALLFLRKTIENCGKWDAEIKEYVYSAINDLGVELNGSYCLSLGTTAHIIPRNSSKNIISLAYSTNNDDFKISYEISNEIDLFLKPFTVYSCMTTSKSLFMQEFYYLNAERIGPRINQKIKFNNYPNVGYQGEFVAQLIADTDVNYQYKIDPKRHHPLSKSPRLEQQVNFWLDEIMPGVSIYASYNAETQSAQIKVDNLFTKGDPTIATNIGFGISYVLPIIVTGLIAKENSFMVVENPEAHLHPSAQSKIGRFLSIVASAGVKVIVETHSDHVLNGIQISTIKNEISSDFVTINFFSQSNDLNQPKIETITINENGELSKWPKGFFDQTQLDFAELFKFRKR